MAILGFQIKAKFRHDFKSKHNRQKSRQSKQHICLAGVRGVGGGGGWGLPLRSPKGLRRQSPEINLLDSTDHLDWLKADSNVAKEITVQNHKCTKTIYAFCHKIQQGAARSGETTAKITYLYLRTHQKATFEIHLPAKNCCNFSCSMKSSVGT